jgi:hypothetical protein
MAKKPAEPPQPIVWNVYKFASKAVWMGTVEALPRWRKAAAEFAVPAKRILAIRR